MKTATLPPMEVCSSTVNGQVTGKMQQSPDPRVEQASVSAVADWEGPHDPLNPQNWSKYRKIFAVTSLCSLAFCTSFSSSIFAPATTVIAHEFGVSETVANLGVSLYVLGFATGPLLWAPLSEAFGRRLPLCTAMFLFVIFQVPVAVGKNAATIIVSRFFSGAAGSAAFSIPPAMAVDFLTPAQRLICVNLYMALTLLGPFAGPIAGTYLTVQHGWRWTAWVSLVVGGICTAVAVVALPETCAEVLLRRKATRLRKEAGDLFLAKGDDHQTQRILLQKTLVRPALMLMMEPILLAITVYSAFVYGVLYLWLFALPYCFQERRGWTPEHASLDFLSTFVGALVGCVTVAISDATWWLRRFLNRGRKICPEDRLLWLAVSAIVLPVGLFWYAWTSSPRTPWPAQVCAGILIGGGIVLNLLSTTAYLIDVYLLNSNFAVAAYISVRSATAAAFRLFAVQMYRHLGSEWATSVLALICVALAPVPFVLWICGKRIRGWSRYSFDVGAAVDDEA